MYLLLTVQVHVLAKCRSYSSQIHRLADFQYQTRLGAGTCRGWNSRIRDRLYEGGPVHVGAVLPVEIARDGFVEILEGERQSDGIDAQQLHAAHHVNHICVGNTTSTHVVCNLMTSNT